MTIEQVEELRKQEMGRTLRLPKLLIEKDEIRKALYIRWAIFKVMESETFLKKLVNKSILRKAGVKISGKGTGKKHYKFKTPFGEGQCFDIKYLFKDKKCPLEVGACFSNSFNLASTMAMIIDDKVTDCVSGILYANDSDGERSILHSVFEFDDFVVDANFGMCISKELYYKVFMFEELVRITGKQINEVQEILTDDTNVATAKKFNLKTYHLVFALEDMINFITNEKRQSGCEAFSDLDYRY